MEFIEESTTTYIMFTLNGNMFKRVVGPFFRCEKTRIEKTMFPCNVKTHLLEETLFAAKFPNVYFEHIQAAWLDKVNCYISHHKSWIGQTTLSVSERCITGTFFGLFEIEDKDGCKSLQLNISIDSNPFFVARFRQDLIDMDILPIVSGKTYYLDPKGVVHTEQALRRKLAEDQLLISGKN